MPTSQAAPNVTALNAVTALSNPNGLLIQERPSDYPQCPVVHNLQPSTQYSFVEAACTTAGCQTGGVANVTTLDSACGPSSPLILNTNSSSMSLQWNAPLQPDYVITAYTLPHRVPSLKSQSEMWAPPSTATVQFHTYNPSGILFYQINSVVTDFLGVKLHGGLPCLIFDVGSGPAVVGSNSTRTFNNGVRGTVSVSAGLQLNTLYVTVDTVHAAAITAAIVPLLTMKVYFEGFPSTSSRYGIEPLTACVLSPPEWSSSHVCRPVGMGVISAAASLPSTLSGRSMPNSSRELTLNHQHGSSIGESLQG
eukprot:Em0015g557a